MKHPARWVALSVAVVVALFAVVLATQVGGNPERESQRSALLGKPAPELAVQALDGSRVTNADLSGKAVIINFWNSWCPPCRAELPALKAFYGRHAEDPDFLMLGIVRDDTKKAVREYVDAEGMKWTIAFDPGSNAVLNFGVRGQPETFAISPDGVIVAFQYSEARLRDLEAMLLQARRT